MRLLPDSAWRLRGARSLRTILNRGWPLLAVAFVGAALRPLPAGAIDLPTIRAALQSHVDTIKTLEGRYRGKSTYHAKREPGRRYFDERRAEGTFAADIEHGRVAVEELDSFIIKNLSPVRFVVRRVNRFDGQSSYNLAYTNKESPFLELGPPADVPHHLQIKGGDDTRSSYLVSDFAGMRLHAFGGGTLSALVRVEPAEVKEEKVDGNRCIRVTVTKKNERLIAWLDPEQSFIPRQIQVFKTQEGGDWKLMEDLKSLEFERYSLGATGNENECVLPVRCRAQNWAEMEHDLEFIDLKVNVSLPIEIFQVDPATLADGVQVDGGPGKSFMTGDRTDLFRERNAQLTAFNKHCEQEIAKNSPADAAARELAPVQATPPNTSRWPVASLLGGSLVLLVLGVVLVVRAYRR
jgi:hypothetical protein